MKSWTRALADAGRHRRLIVGVAWFGMHVGMTALAIAAVLILARTVDETKAIRAMPWGVILMVTGVTVLVSMLEKTKGMELFTEWAGEHRRPVDAGADRRLRHGS